jgi:YD repeat-containing protein
MTVKKSQNKIFLTGILVTIASISAKAQKNDYEDISLKGHVKTMVEIKSYATDSVVFNGDGKVTEVWSLNDGQWNLSNEIAYDRYQNKVVYKEFYDSELSAYYEFSYDVKNNLLETKYFLADNSLMSSISYNYNETGKLVLEEYKNPDGTVYETVTYTYNAEGLCSERTDKYGSVANVYDAQGRVIEENSVFQDLFEKKPMLTSRTFTYNSAGQNIGWITKDKKGKVMVTSTSTYDEMGNYTGGTWVTKDENLSFVYTYEYDENGNWTKYDGATLTERRFTYY